MEEDEESSFDVFGFGGGCGFAGSMVCLCWGGLESDPELSESPEDEESFDPRGILGLGGGFGFAAGGVVCLGRGRGASDPVLSELPEDDEASERRTKFGIG